MTWPTPSIKLLTRWFILKMNFFGVFSNWKCSVLTCIWLFDCIIINLLAILPTNLCCTKSVNINSAIDDGHLEAKLGLKILSDPFLIFKTFKLQKQLILGARGVRKCVKKCDVLSEWTLIYKFLRKVSPLTSFIILPRILSARQTFWTLSFTFMKKQCYPSRLNVRTSLPHLLLHFNKQPEPIL